MRRRPGKRMRRWVRGVGLLAAVACTSVSSAFVVGGTGGAQVRQQTTAKTYPPGPQGTNILLETKADLNFCLSNVVVEGRPTSIQQCSAIDSQHWTFAQSADNSSVLVDGGGQCLEAPAKIGKPAQANPCTFLTPEHFLFKDDGELQTVSGKLCLEYAVATTDAAVFFVPCDKTQITQMWQLAH
jgi:hypothetical protein